MFNAHNGFNIPYWTLAVGSAYPKTVSSLGCVRTKLKSFSTPFCAVLMKLKNNLVRDLSNFVGGADF